MLHNNNQSFVVHQTHALFSRFRNAAYVLNPAAQTGFSIQYTCSYLDSTDWVFYSVHVFLPWQHDWVFYSVHVFLPWQHWLGFLFSTRFLTLTALTGFSIQYTFSYLDSMARGVTSRDCFSMAKVIPRASFSRTALVAYSMQIKCKPTSQYV